MFKELENLNSNFIDNENVKELSPELKEVWNEMFICRNKIEAVLRNRPSKVMKFSWSFESDVPVAAYLLAKSFEIEEQMDKTSFQSILTVEKDEDIIGLASENGIKDLWEKLIVLTKEHKQKIFYLAANLKELSNPLTTPESIYVLAENILDIKKDDVIADLCCGTGTVAQSIKINYPTVEVKGFDVSRDAIAVAKVYNSISKEKIEYERKDVFDFGLDELNTTKFTKIFADYPFGMRMKDLNAGRDYLEKLTEKIPSMSKATSSDWLYNKLMVDMLTEDGKAVAIMTNGSTWNSIDTEIRREFVENGLVECVIALPAKLFPTTNIATSMIVFSHNNKGIRLVDASELYVAGRRVNEMNDEIIDKILAAMKEDSDISMFVDLEMLRDNDYVMSMTRYANMNDDIEYGMEFGDVIKRITRGAPLNAKKLDELSSPIPTDMQYLMLSNIQNGIIDKELPYLTEIDDKNKKYCLSNHCLILSKNGYPYKIAVAEVKEDQKIMANGNLYVIELNEDKIDPYYLAAYLGSEQGTASLKRITVGATIPNIGVEQLKKMVIPVPDLKKQKEIADKYMAIKDEISMLELKIEKAKNRMAHIFEEGGAK